MKELSRGVIPISLRHQQGVKAIIHDEYLHTPDTAHKVLQDILSRLGPLPVIEEEQALVYLHQKHYREALNIYERILPEWYPPSEKLNIGPLEEYRRAAICAACLGDWAKAATFFENGAKIVQRVGGTEEWISLYADAGFAQFKAGNMLDSIKLLNLALEKFEMFPQDNTDVKYFTLKKRLAHTMGWMAGQKRENDPLDEEPPVGFCSHPQTSKEVLTLPDFPMGYSWLYLAQIEYKFGHGTTALEHALQITDREAYPVLSFFLDVLEAQYNFRDKAFNDLPQRIHQLGDTYDSIQRHDKRGEGIREKGIYYRSIADVPNFADVKEIINMLVASLLVQLAAGIDTREILSIWRTNSSELPIKDNMIIALDLIESMLFGDKNDALTVMRTPEVRDGKRLAAALSIVHNIETSPEDLFYAHIFITSAFIDQIWEDAIATDLSELLSVQWLEKIKSGAMSQMSKITVRRIEQACNNCEIGKKKIGQILLAAYPVVSLRVPSEILQQFHSWSDNPRKSDS